MKRKERTYGSVIHQIKDTEEIKDEFLKVSRQERRESRFSGEQLYWISITKVWAGVVALFLIGFFLVCLRGCAL